MIEKIDINYEVDRAEASAKEAGRGDEPNATLVSFVYILANKINDIIEEINKRSN